MIHALILLILVVVSAGRVEDERLIEWIQSHGVDLSGFKWPAYDSNGVRGVQATVKFNANQEYFRLPKELVFDLVFDTKGVQVDDYDKRILAVVEERIKGNGSFWKPFLDVIGYDIPESVTEWSDEELNELQDDEFKNEVVALRSDIARRHENSVGVLNLDKSVYSFELFKWGFLIFSQRAFGIDGKAVLVPFADLFNHNNVFSHFECTEDGSFRLVPAFDVEPGEECWNAYGFLDNFHTLKDYGFVLFPNYADRVKIGNRKVLGSRYVLQVERLRDDHPKVAYLQYKFKGDSEVVAVERLLLELKKLVQEFPTSLSEDYAKVQISHSYRMKMALLYRIGRKEEYLRIASLFIDYYNSITKFSEELPESEYSTILESCIERRLPNGGYKHDLDMGTHPISPMESYGIILNFSPSEKEKDEL